MKKISNPEPWGRAHARGVTDLDTLAALGLLDAESKARGKEIKNNFDVRLPDEFLNLVAEEKALHRQFVPSAEELKIAAEEMVDPIGDERHSPVPYVTHRYPDRALLKVTYTCGVYCRFCFRRYKVASGENASPAEIERAIAYIAAHPEIREVILTGGDPLVLGDARLEKIFASLNAIEHLDTLRVHMRMPTAVPSRVNSALLDILRNSNKPTWLVLHTNHARELTEGARDAIARLASAGIPLLNQSVLLRGVNDDVETLKELSRALIKNRVRPYYLHYLDPARGTSHFRVPLTRAVELVTALRGQLSGFAIPQLVVDTPGGHGKLPVDGTWAESVGGGTWRFLSPLDLVSREFGYTDR